MNRFQLRGAIAALALSAVCGAFAAAFTPGNLVVLQVGADGGATLTNAAQPIFLKEFTTAGVLVQTVPINSVGPGNRITQSGTATSEGHLQLGTLGLTFVGYNADAGTASVVGTTSAAVNRMVGVVGLNGAVDLSTALSDAYSANNIRCAVSGPSNGLWTAGTASAANGPGVRYTSLAGTTSTQLSTTVTNIRVVEIYNGQLYCATQSGSNIGISTVGTGLPTASGETISLLPGMTNDVVNGNNQSPYDFTFFNDSTLYVADDRTSTNGGGLIKYTKDSFGTWSVAYRLQLGLPATFSGARSVSVVGADGGGNAILAVTAGQQGESASVSNELLLITDTGALSSFTSIATSPTNTKFRGVVAIPGAQKSISGTISLASYVGNPSARAMTFEVVDGSSTTVQTETLNLDGSNGYSFSTSVANGTYDVYVKGTTWLRKKVASVNVTSSGATVSTTLDYNGDLDNNNVIDSDDFDTLVADFGGTGPGDIDGSGNTDSDDFDILVANFGLGGD